MSDRAGRIDLIGAELDDKVTGAILERIDELPDTDGWTSVPRTDLRWLAATVRNLRGHLAALVASR